MLDVSKVRSLDIGCFEFCVVGRRGFGCGASSNIPCGGSMLDAGDSYRQTVLIGLEGALSRYM